MRSDPTRASDEELLRRTEAGDKEAFVELYRRRQGEIYRFAWHMSGSRTVAEEVTQEVFLILVRGESKYERSRGTVAAFLFGAARNHVLRCLERDGKYVAIYAAGTVHGHGAGYGSGDEGDAPGKELVSADNPLGELVRNETIEAVRRAVLALPEAYREAVVLCDLSEMSYAEAARAMGCPEGTVRSRLHRARALLAERLGEQGQNKVSRCAV